MRSNHDFRHGFVKKKTKKVYSIIVYFITKFSLDINRSDKLFILQNCCLLILDKILRNHRDQYHHSIISLESLSMANQLRCPARFFKI